MCLWYAARRCGIYDITDDYLVLLSHGIQVCLRLPLLAPPFILSFAPLSLSLSLCVCVCVCQAGEVKRCARKSNSRQPTQNRVPQG